MARKDFDVDELAAYLHLTPEQVLKLASREKLPGRRVGGQWRFSESEIHHWLEEKIGVSSLDELDKVEALLRRAPLFDHQFQLTDLLQIEAIAVPLQSRTRGSVIRDMCALAANTGYLWDADVMAEAVQAREQLHPTALENGVALLHPRRPQSAILSMPILALGISSQPIAFGNQSGHLTDVFFLICSTDDQIHLRILARLSRLISDNRWLETLRAATNPIEALELVRSAEAELARAS